MGHGYPDYRFWSIPALVGEGGTGWAALTLNALVVGNAGSPVQLIGPGLADQILRTPTDGAAPAWGALDLSKAAAVSGLLPIPHGGTGTATGSITGTGALTFAAGGANQNIMLTPSGAAAAGVGVGVGMTPDGTPDYALWVKGGIKLNYPVDNPCCIEINSGLTGPVLTQLFFSDRDTHKFTVAMDVSGGAITSYSLRECGVGNRIAFLPLGDTQYVTGAATAHHRFYYSVAIDAVVTGNEPALSVTGRETNPASDPATVLVQGVNTTSTALSLKNLTAGGLEWRARSTGAADPKSGAAGWFYLWNSYNRAAFLIDPAATDYALLIDDSGIQTRTSRTDSTRVQIRNQSAGGLIWEARSTGAADPMTATAGWFYLWNNYGRAPFFIDPSAISNTLKLDASGVWTVGSFISTVATGTAPLGVSSTTEVINLNADRVGGTEITNATVAGQLLIGSGTGTAAWSTPDGCRVYNSADESVGNGSYTALTFDTERYDNGGLHSLASNTSRLTAQTPGKHLISGHVAWDISATGGRETAIKLNGSTFIAADIRQTMSAVNAEISISTVYHLAANDYVELFVYQNSGGNLSVKAFPGFSPEFAMQWLGP